MNNMISKDEITYSESVMRYWVPREQIKPKKKKKNQFRTILNFKLFREQFCFLSFLFFNSTKQSVFNNQAKIPLYLN